MEKCIADSTESCIWSHRQHYLGTKEVRKHFAERFPGSFKDFEKRKKYYTFAEWKKLWNELTTGFERNFRLGEGAMELTFLSLASAKNYNGDNELVDGEQVVHADTMWRWMHKYIESGIINLNRSKTIARVSKK
jgi:hypothetical protein